jgi:hypothetical protein
VDEDILYVLEHQNILRNSTLNCEKDFLVKILEVAGRQGRTILMDQIRWKPYKSLLEIEKTIASTATGNPI